MIFCLVATIKKVILSSLQGLCPSGSESFKYKNVRVQQIVLSTSPPANTSTAEEPLKVVGGGDLTLLVMQITVPTYLMAIC